MAILASGQDRIAATPHHLLAVTHAFGLLQEAFPDRFPSTPRYRFGWDDPAAYRCRVIVNHHHG